MEYTIKCQRPYCGARHSYDGAREPGNHLVERHAEGQGWVKDAKEGWVCTFHAMREKEPESTGKAIYCALPGCVSFFKSNTGMPNNWAKFITEAGPHKYVCPSCFCIGVVQNGPDSLDYVGKPIPPREPASFDPGKWLDEVTARIQKLVQDVRPKPESPPATPPIHCCEDGCLNQCAAASYEEAAAMGWITPLDGGDQFICYNCQAEAEKDIDRYAAGNMRELAAEEFYHSLKRVLRTAKTFSDNKRSVLELLEIGLSYLNPEGRDNAGPNGRTRIPDETGEPGPGACNIADSDSGSVAGSHVSGEQPGRKDEGYPF